MSWSKNVGALKPISFRLSNPSVRHFNASKICQTKKPPLSLWRTYICLGNLISCVLFPPLCSRPVQFILSIFPGGMKRNPPPPSLSSHSGHSSSLHGVFREHIILCTVWSVLISTLARSIQGEVFFEQKKAWNHISIDGPAKGGEVKNPLEVYPHTQKSQKFDATNALQFFFLWSQ